MSNNDPRSTYLVALYGGRPMHEVSKEWVRRTGANTPGGLAAELGLDEAEIERWLDPASDVHLSWAELGAYDQRVTVIEMRRRGGASAS